MCRRQLDRRLSGRRLSGGSLSGRRLSGRSLSGRRRASRRRASRRRPSRRWRLRPLASRNPQLRWPGRPRPRSLSRRNPHRWLRPVPWRCVEPETCALLEGFATPTNMAIARPRRRRIAVSLATARSTATARWRKVVALPARIATARLRTDAPSLVTAALGVARVSSQATPTVPSRSLARARGCASWIPPFTPSERAPAKSPLTGAASPFIAPVTPAAASSWACAPSCRRPTAPSPPSVRHRDHAASAMGCARPRRRPTAGNPHSAR